MYGEKQVIELSLVREHVTGALLIPSVVCLIHYTDVQQRACKMTMPTKPNPLGSADYDHVLCTGLVLEKSGQKKKKSIYAYISNYTFVNRFSDHAHDRRKDYTCFSLPSKPTSSRLLLL